MSNEHRLRLSEQSALHLFDALGGYLQHGQMTDNSEFCDENMVEVEDIRRSLAMSLRGPALDALRNILETPTSVTQGNGVTSDGDLYEDVEAGLKLAKAILEAI